MKWILLTCLAVATSASVDPVYQGGHEFSYKYESQVLTGLPNVDDQYSGFKIRANARFQFTDRSGYLKTALKLDDIRVFKVHGKIGRENTPSDLVPESQLEDITSTEQGVNICKFLTTTTSFNFHNGRIEEMRVEEEEPHWSINFKKGIIQILVVNVQSQNTYTATEEDILGKCDSQYTVGRTTPYVFLQKIRLLDSCTERPVTDSGIFAGLPQLMDYKNILEPTAHYSYRLSTSGQRFSIHEAEVKAVYAFMPYQKETGSTVTYTHQTLERSQWGRISNQLDTSKLTREEKSLQYTVPDPVLPSKYDRMGYNKYGSNTQDKISEVDEVMTTITNKMKATPVPEDISADFLRVTDLLREFQATDFMTLVHKYSCNDGSCRRKLEILCDILPSLPNPAVVEVVYTLVNEKLVVGMRASLMINTFALTAKPTPETIDRCLQLYKRFRSQNSDDVLVTRSLILCIGTLANRMNNMHMKVGLHLQTPKPILRGLVSEIRDMLRSASDVDEKIRLVKAIGNFGEMQFLPELRTIIQNQQNPTTLRTNAIYAVRKFADNKRAQNEVYNLCFGVFMNTQENVRVRTAAFLIVMKTRPSYHVFETIGHRMETEPQHQIKTLVYSVYLKLAKTQNGPVWMRDMTKSARRCLKWFVPVKIMPWDTQVMHNEGYSDVMKMSADFEMFIMKSPSSVLPQSMVTYLSGSLFGKYFNLVETGFDTAGLEKIIKKIIHWINLGDFNLQGILNVLATDQSNVHGSYIRQEIDNILNKMPVHEMEDSEFHAWTYFKILGHEMQYMTFNKNDILNLLSVGNLQDIFSSLATGTTFRITKAMTLVDNSLTVPTPAGVPVYLNTTMVHFCQFSSYIKLEGFESIISRALTGGITSLSSLKVNVQARVDSRTLFKLESGSSIFCLKSGMANRFRVDYGMNFDNEFSWDPNTMKVAIKTKLPDRRVNVFQFVAEPYSYFGKKPCQHHSSPYIYEELPLRNPVLSRPVEREYDVPLLVIPAKVNVVSKMTYGTPRWSANFPLMGKQEFYVTFNKQSHQCPHITTEIDLKDIPAIFDCKTGSGNSWRSSRKSLFDYTYNTGMDELRPDESFTEKCRPVKLPIAITVEDSPSTRIDQQLSYIRSPDWMIHQIRYMFDGQSLYNLPYGMKNLKFYAETVYNFEHLVHHTGTPIVKFRFASGSSRFDENYVTLKVLLDAPESAFGRYHAPSNDYKNYKLTIVLEHSHLTPMMRGWLQSCQNQLPYVPNVDFANLIASNDIVKFYLKVVPAWQKCYLAIDAGRNGWQSDRHVIELPWNVPYMMPASLNEPYSVVVPPYHRRMTHQIGSYGKCSFERKEMRTFDGKTVSLPRIFSEPSCEMLAARDCSHSHQFTLTLKPVGHSGQKAIKLIVPEYKIEITPETSSHWYSWNKQVGLKLRINDQEVELNSHDPVVLVSKGFERNNVCRIEKTLSKNVVIDCKVGVSVVYNGANVAVSPKASFQGQLCGLCGDYNMDTHNDVPSQCFSPEECMKELFLKYTLKSNQCRIHDYEI